MSRMVERRYKMLYDLSLYLPIYWIIHLTVIGLSNCQNAFFSSIPQLVSRHKHLC